MAAKTVTFSLSDRYKLTRTESGVIFDVSDDKDGKRGELIVSKGNLYWIQASAKTKANGKRNAKRISWTKLIEDIDEWADAEVR